MKPSLLISALSASVILAGCSSTPDSPQEQATAGIQQFVFQGQVTKNEQGYMFSPCGNSDIMPLTFSNDNVREDIEEHIADNKEKANGDSGYLTQIEAYIKTGATYQDLGITEDSTDADTAETAQEDLGAVGGNIDDTGETFIGDLNTPNIQVVGAEIANMKVAPKMTCQFVYEAQNENDAQFVGQYQANLAAASSPGRTISLALNPDHSATMVFDYQNNEPSIIETGYWQAYTDGRVNLIMTKHNDRSLVSVRTFTKEDQTLTAYQESVNDQVYSFGSEGLHLTAVEADPTQEQAPEGVASDNSAEDLDTIDAMESDANEWEETDASNDADASAWKM